MQHWQRRWPNAMPKRDLNALLGQKQGTPEIRRGQGFKLSTEDLTAPETSISTTATQPEAAAPEDTSVPRVPPTQEPPPADTARAAPPGLSAALPVAVTSHLAAESPAIPAAPNIRQKPELGTRGASRLNRGFAVRPDLAQKFKVIAAIEGRPIYDVMEEAMQRYWDAWHAAHPEIHIGL